eukprot:COSAG06_NODE_158_length_21760_cov_36.036979_9_plen_67_part_00
MSKRAESDREGECIKISLEVKIEASFAAETSEQCGWWACLVVTVKNTQLRIRARNNESAAFGTAAD